MEISAHLRGKVLVFLLWNIEKEREEKESPFNCYAKRFQML